MILTVLALLFEEKLIYFPSAALAPLPSELALEHEELFLETDDGERVHGWFLPSPVSTAWSDFHVLMSHGNAGNISHRLDRTLLMHQNLGVPVLLYDYRGFGRSTGSPDEAGTYEDARAAYRYLTGELGVPPARVVLFGESLGAAVTLQLATEVEAAAVVLEAPFASIAAMAKAVYPFVPSGWVRTRYDNLRKASERRQPLLVIHGTEDKTVPFEQGRAVFDAASGPKRFLEVPGAGHSDAFLVGGQAYWDAWREILGLVK